MKTQITSSTRIKAMVKALRLAGLPVKSSDAGHWLTHKTKGDVFRAMKGSRGDYLLRFDPMLFQETH
jgi:hypothetical protein